MDDTVRPKTTVDARAMAQQNALPGGRLGALLDAAVDPIVLIDTAGCITRFNRAAETVFGYAGAEVVGQDVSMLMPQPYREEHDGYLDRYRRTRSKRIIGTGREVLGQRKDGSTFPVDLTVGEFRDGDDHGFVGILRDITQRKHNEAAIRRTSEELRLIFDNAPTAITITDLDGHVINANRACSSLLGYSAEEMMRLRHTDLIAAEDREQLRDQFLALRSSCVGFTRDVEYRRQDGSTLVAHLTAEVGRDSDGNPVIMICEILDRTAQFKAEREAEELRNRLAHVNRIGTLGEMVSGIAHEVNQPLTAITNYISAARRLVSRDDTNGDLVEILEKIAVQAERAGQVIRGLRNMTRRHRSDYSMADCNELIREVARLFEAELPGRAHQLGLALANGLPTVHCDRVQVQQVILNLVRNGHEAMEESGRGQRIVVTTHQRGERIEISVCDDGPGLSKESAEHLFEPFYTTKPQGMGLGLSICKSIAMAHGGDLVWQARDGGGTCFTLSLPLEFPL